MINICVVRHKGYIKANMYRINTITENWRIVRIRTFKSHFLNLIPIW